MYLRVEEFKENKSRAAAKTISQKKGIGKQSIGFVNNRNPVFQLKTDIRHTAANITWEGATGKVGKKMTAKLDPTDPVVGSQTSPQLMTPLDTKVASYNTGMWARGHLLNHDLGGFGVPDNLYPISAGANAHHAQAVEYPVKKALSKAASNRSTGKGVDGINIFYQVEVKGTPSHSQFHCSWNYADADFKSIKSINTAIIESKLNDSQNSSIQEPYFSARGKPESLPAWHHGDRAGTMNGAQGFNDVDRVQSVNDLVGIPSIDPLDVPTAKELTDEQKEEIAKASMEHKLAVAYQKQLDRISRESLEQAKIKIAQSKLPIGVRRSPRLSVMALSSQDDSAILKEKIFIAGEMRRKANKEYEFNKKKFLKK